MPLPDYGYGNREARRKSQLVGQVCCMSDHPEDNIGINSFADLHEPPSGV